MLCTPKPNGFADHYPVFKWLFHWEYTQHFQTNPFGELQKLDTAQLQMRDWGPPRLCFSAIPWSPLIQVGHGKWHAIR